MCVIAREVVLTLLLVMRPVPTPVLVPQAMMRAIGLGRRAGKRPSIARSTILEVRVKVRVGLGFVVGVWNGRPWVWERALLLHSLGSGQGSIRVRVRVLLG